MYLLIFIGTYLVIGNLLHRVIFREKKPDISTYFKPGQEFYSKAEGFRQKVIKQENGFVYGTLEAEPFAAGPPKHIHNGFDETFEIENGELTIWVDGEVKKLRPGQVLHVPKGVPHKPYNETGDTIRIKGSFAFPEKFAFYLQQVYGYMDNNPGFMKSPKTILQMSLLQPAGFDSYIADGPPVFIQKAMGFVVAPLARLLGYRSYYEQYDVQKNKEATGSLLRHQ
ncbi:MAG: cupin domain-containing protein [Chitinophagaceae bacterium]|nr:cupin domain-containing protein [Chitinophagaceae bacterium]